MNDRRREPDTPREAPRPSEGGADYVRERELKEDGRYIIFYSFGDEEDD
jgi:hypothetical protein